MKKLAVILATFLIVACQTPTKKDTAQQTQGGNNNGGTTVTNTSDKDKTNDNSAGGASIYFDLNKAVIHREYNETIQNEAQAIKRAKNSAVTLEGNTDERGSAEYNLGLGQRRADAVKKLLVAAGVPGSHIKTTSLGKEKPKATCHDESCWKENRRVDFVQGS